MELVAVNVEGAGVGRVARIAVVAVADSSQRMLEDLGGRSRKLEEAWKSAGPLELIVAED